MVLADYELDAPRPWEGPGMEGAMKDEYGTMLREKMKESMGEPFTPLNRRKGDVHKVTPLQFIVGTLALICIVVELAYQIGLKVRP
jgi:hypothetical protein